MYSTSTDNLNFNLRCNFNTIRSCYTPKLYRVDWFEENNRTFEEILSWDISKNPSARRNGLSKASVALGWLVDTLHLYIFPSCRDKPQVQLDYPTKTLIFYCMPAHATSL